MQPDHQYSSPTHSNSAASGTANGATTGATNPDTNGSPFKATPFGAVPEKRASIDESWVNVDWNELARKNQTEGMDKAEKTEKTEPISFGWGAKPHFETPKDIPTPQKPVDVFKPTEHKTESPYKAFEHKAPEHKTESPYKAFEHKVESPYKAPEHKVESPYKAFEHKVESPYKAPEHKTESPYKAPEHKIESPYKASEHKTESPFKATDSFAKPVAESLPKQSVEQKVSNTHNNAYNNAHSNTSSNTPSNTPGNTPSKPAPAKSETATPAREPAPSLPPTISAHATPTTANVPDATASPSKATPKARTPKQSKASTPATPRSSGRQRKTVDRLSPVASDRTEMKAIEIPSGSGTKFSDITHSTFSHWHLFIFLVSKELGKRKSDYPSLVLLHRIIFGRPGEAAKRKGNLRQFNGLSDDAVKITEKLTHHSVDELKDLCGLLNLEHGGEKKALADRITKYLENPTDLGESKPAPKRTPQKRKAASPKSRKAKVAKKSAADAADMAVEESGSEDDASMLEDLQVRDDEE